MSEDRFEEAKRVLTDENWQDLWCPWCPPQFELFKWCVEEIERLRALWQAHLEPGGTVSNVPPIRVLTKEDMAKMDPPFPPEPKEATERGKEPDRALPSPSQTLSRIQIRHRSIYR